MTNPHGTSLGGHAFNKSELVEFLLPWASRRRANDRLERMAKAGQDKFDCLVIGGGPAGLTAAIYLARYRRNVRVIDSRESRAALIPESHNYPGFASGVSGKSLLALLTSQAETYGVRIVHDRVESLQRSDG